MLKFLRPTGIAQRLTAMMTLVVVAMIILGGQALLSKRDVLLQEKKQQLASHEQMALTILQHHYAEQQSGKVTEAQAKAAAMSEMMDLRYDGNNYFSVFHMATRSYAAHPFLKDLIDKPEDTYPALVREVGDHLVAAAQASADGSYYAYQWPKPGAPLDAPKGNKLALSKPFAPWDLSVSTGLYTDDVDAAFWHDARLFLSGVAGLCLALGAVCWMITRSITRPIQSAVQTAHDIANGHFDTKIATATGEAGELMASMAQIQSTLKAFRAAQIEMHRAHQAGKISFKMETDRFQGHYAAMANDINVLVGEHIAVKMEIVKVVTAYAQGDFTPLMSRLPGEKAKITETIDAVKTSFESISNEVIKLASAAGRGDFTVRGDESRYANDFKTMVSNLNSLMTISDAGLNEIARVLGALAAGDLTERMEGTYQGTFEQLKNDMNRTIESLSEIVSELRSASGSIHTASAEIASGNMDLSARTENQAASLEETASAMEELTSTVKATAENARQANALTEAAEASMAKSADAVSDVVRSMEGITESSRKIAEIINVIEGISFQTNILALNAAVESARAGEQGRGFAVVASEVRALAGRSSEAAKEIKGLISEARERVEQGSSQVQLAGRAMQELQTSFKSVQTITAEITQATVEQSAGIEQVNGAITAMDSTTQQNAALVEEAAAAAASMKEQASTLQEVMARFTVESSSAALRLAA